MRPIIVVSASARARATSTAIEPVAVAEQPLAGGAQLQRQARVDDVAARQAEVEVAALRPDRLGDLGHEGDDVVVGRALDLGDPLDVDLGAGLDAPRAPRPGSGRAPPGRGRRRARPGASARSGPPPTRSRPSRRACSGGSSGGLRGGRRPSAPMSWRRWTPVEGDQVGGGLRRAARRREVRAAPDDGQDPAAVRPIVAGRPSRPRVPPWNTSAPRARARSEALDRVVAAWRIGVAGRRQHDPDRGDRAGPAAGRLQAERPGRVEQPPAAAASSNGPSGAASRGRIACVSGSPNRALHSSRTGPSAVSMRPA